MRGAAPGRIASARIERPIRGRTYAQWVGETEACAVRAGRAIAYGGWTVAAWEAEVDPAEFVACADRYLPDEAATS